MYKCPHCKSKNIKYDPWIGQMWRCPDCNYRGPLVIETDGDLKDNIEKERILKDMKTIDLKRRPKRLSQIIIFIMFLIVMFLVNDLIAIISLLVGTYYFISKKW